MKHLLLLVAGALVLLSTGCATVVRGDKQKVKIMTEPSEATLVVDGKSYVTPAEVVLKRKDPHDITISKEGYQAITFKFKANWDAGGAGAVVLDAVVPGGTALFLIDVVAGADRQFDEIATIKLPKTLAPSTQPVVFYEYKGKLLSKVEYDEAVEKDKIFKSNKSATAKPSGDKSAGTN